MNRKGSSVCEACPCVAECREIVARWDGSPILCEGDAAEVSSVFQRSTTAFWERYDALLGTMLDADLARQLEISYHHVGSRRRKLNIPVWKEPEVEWPPQLCGCGCGQYTKPAQSTNRKKGTVKGKPQRFLAGHFSPKFHNRRKDVRISLQAVCLCISSNTKGTGLFLTFSSTTLRK